MREKDFLKMKIIEMVEGIDNVDYLSKIKNYVFPKFKKEKEKSQS